MRKIRTALKKRLKAAQRVAVLGVGSELRGDDAVGTVIAKELKGHIKKKKTRLVKVFLGHTAPENLTGEIKKFEPTHLIIVDAVDFHGKAGAVKVIDTYKEAGSSFSTHKMPVWIIRDYLYRAIGCETIILGIQPQSLEFSFVLSPEVCKTARIVSEEIAEVLK